ncbi:MAG TPA: hypothetical protein VGS22_25220 [Thermoanaerobaculia bacterium]|jgi:hypothetical protein|nr:hypothetical protein [Thermoanaerobaculia bacterium]
MTRFHVLPLAALLIGLAAAPAAHATDCTMKFNLTSWSIFYKASKGSGTITCDNGQTATVRLEGKGGGLTAGRSKVRDGFGKFSEVGDIKELFGTYVAGGASAGAVKSSEAQALTKGEVSLALAGNGTGVELGVSFGKFTISRR